jgi:hypothetical protein
VKRLTPGPDLECPPSVILTYGSDLHSSPSESSCLDATSRGNSCQVSISGATVTTDPEGRG